MPVAAANARKMAGTYSSQWAVANPVCQIPSQITELINRKKTRTAELALLIFIRDLLCRVVYLGASRTWCLDFKIS